MDGASSMRIGLRGEMSGNVWRLLPAECPRISVSFLEEERRRQGSDWVRQEYFCEFIEDGSQMFSRDLVRRSLDDALEPLEFKRGDSMRGGRVEIHRTKVEDTIENPRPHGTGLSADTRM
jgi:hypothetical protein